jgi:predicted transposase YbfD/YdcC
MLPQENLMFMKIFKHVEDPRIERNKLYPLIEILLVAFATLLSGGETYTDMEDFGNSKLMILRDLLPFKNGIPSEDTFERVFNILNPKQFGQCFVEWVEFIREKNEAIIAIDGKSLRGSGSHKKRPLHMVMAWANQNKLVLGCTSVDEKSNEITAIPEILKLLSLKGATVTLDAMGCQVGIANQIVESGGDFVISLKGNQGSLHEDVRLFFEQEMQHKLSNKIDVHYTETEKNHDRIDKRTYGLCNKIRWLNTRHPHWPLKGIGFVESIRIIRGKESKETRYFITTHKDVRKFAYAVRSHWGIENSAHGLLDITFHEDNSRVRNRNAAYNLAVIRRVAMNTLEKDTTPKRSKRRKKLISGWDDAYLKDMLTKHI